MELPIQSQEIDKLTAAFVEARKAFMPVREDCKANYGSYVSLEEIKACTNAALLANGLSLTQGRTWSNGTVLLVTKLAHVSGQWQCSYMPLFIGENVKNIDQAYGSAMSYERRYELYGLFSIKGEDLDPDSAPSSTTINEKQLGLLKYKLKGNIEREAKLCAYYKIGQLSQLPAEYMSEVVATLEK